MNTKIITSIAPWLTIFDGESAVEFYKDAFGAVEMYRMEGPEGGLVVKLSVDGAEFWISSDTEQNIKGDSILPEHKSIRMILTVNNPDILFANALKAGAKEVFPISEDFGWRLGRVIDPFGMHWEIGYPLS
jgi:PhnB protein